MTDDPNIQLVQLAEPEFVDDFCGSKSYIHTKVLWKGDWVLTITMYENVASSRARPEPDDEDDEEDEEPAPAVKARYCTTTFYVHSKWPWLRPSWGSGELASLKDAQGLAIKSVKELATLINQAHQRPKERS